MVPLLIIKFYIHHILLIGTLTVLIYKLKHKRSHDDVEAGSGSDEDNNIDTKKLNHLIGTNEYAYPNEKPINKNLE